MDGTGWIPGLIAAGALAFIWWDIRRNKMANEMKLKKALYRDDGITVFIPRGECDALHASFCKKTDEIRKLVADMDKKRELARNEDSQKWEKLQRTLGRIDFYIEANP